MTEGASTVRGSAILRDLRRLSHLSRRRETIYQLSPTPGGPEPPMLNRLIAADPALAIASWRATPRPYREDWPAVPQIARFMSQQAVFDLLKSSRDDFCDGSNATFN